MGSTRSATRSASNGRELYIFGQYGNERWSRPSAGWSRPGRRRGLATFERELPRVLRAADAADAYIEDKGLAVAVHTRRLDDPDAAFDRLVKPMGELAERHGLVVEPGRQVLEIRSHGMHKGIVVEYLMESLEAGGFLFAGDDLGDLEAFEAVLELRNRACPPSWSARPPARRACCARWPTWSSTAPRASSDLMRRLTQDADPPS